MLLLSFSLNSQFIVRKLVASDYFDIDEFKIGILSGLDVLCLVFVYYDVWLFHNSADLSSLRYLPKQLFRHSSSTGYTK